MRSNGSRRGISALRFMVEQTARRRQWSSTTSVEPGDGGSDRFADRWGRAFFDRLHALMIPHMAAVDAIDGASLRYFGSPEVSLWALVAPQATVVAYDHADSPEQIRDRARRWLRCLSTHTAPGLASPHWGHPVYGARLEPGTGELEVVWALAEPWFEFAISEHEQWWDAPLHWPQPEPAGA